MRLLAFRHAPVALVDVCYGQLDVATVLGAAEAAAIVESQLAGVAVTQIWSSPLSRCADPARALAERLGVKHRVDARLSEIAFGQWEGRTWESLDSEASAAYIGWMSAWKERGPPGGESAIAVEKRVRAWWEDVACGATEVLVAHAGVMRALAVITRARSWEEAMSTAVPHLVQREFGGRGER